MFNAICSKVYQKIREASGLTQEELGQGIATSRHVVRRFETGQTRPDATQERNMMEVTNCSKLAFVELVCAQLGELIGAPVGILTEHGAYEPTDMLERANRLLRQPKNAMSPGMMRALNRKIIATRLLSLLFEFNNTDLEELTQDCREERSITEMTKPKK